MFIHFAIKFFISLLSFREHFLNFILQVYLNQGLFGIQLGFTHVMISAFRY